MAEDVQRAKKTAVFAQQSCSIFAAAAITLVDRNIGPADRRAATRQARFNLRHIELVKAMTIVVNKAPTWDCRYPDRDVSYVKQFLDIPPRHLIWHMSMIAFTKQMLQEVQRYRREMSWLRLESRPSRRQPIAHSRYPDPQTFEDDWTNTQMELYSWLQIWCTDYWPRGAPTTSRARFALNFRFLALNAKERFDTLTLPIFQRTTRWKLLYELKRHSTFIDALLREAFMRQEDDESMEVRE